jgi:ammonium transporter Rh
MIGKVSIWQFLFLSFFQTIVYSGNYVLGAKVIKAVDIGGSMFIHLFGAYWGLAAAWWINPSDMRKRGSYKSQGASYSSDTFAMIGTLFLWLLWPSFNGALAPAGSQARVIINTVLS